MSQKLYELARIVLPTADYADYTDLFVRHETKEIVFGGHLQQVHSLKFDTWMNIFAAKKYFKYCTLTDLYLLIKTDCDCEVVISNIEYSQAEDSGTETIKSAKLTKGTGHQIKIDNAGSYANLYFTLFSENPVIDLEAYWATSTKPEQINKIAIISCTFKREAHIKRNISLFKNFIKDNPYLKDKFELLVVDNGKTLEQSLEGEGVKIYPNNNTGGAGGFTRGIIEAQKDPSFTRIILMDDDVEVFPEAFCRTLVLSDFLKPENSRSFIHGAMLFLSQKNIFWESHGIRTDSTLLSFFGRSDISKARNVAKTNYAPLKIFKNESARIHSAWWFCCFSMKSVEEKGLPMPFFFMGDDIEWSWRNFPESHITLNGLFAWHDDFQWRKSKTKLYFAERNSMFINIIYFPNYKKTMLKFIKRQFRNLLYFYDYSSCRIYLMVLHDMLEGSAVFEKNQTDILKEISSVTKQDIIEDVTEIGVYEKISEEYDSYSKNRKAYHRWPNKIKNIFYKITLFGRLVPMKYWIKSRDLFDGSPHMDFLFVKQVNVYNLRFNEVEIRRFDPKVNRELKKEFKSVISKIDANYDLIKKDYVTAKERFATKEFWIKYLQL